MSYTSDFKNNAFVCNGHMTLVKEIMQTPLQVAGEAQSYRVPGRTRRTEKVTDQPY